MLCGCRSNADADAEAMCVVPPYSFPFSPFQYVYNIHYLTRSPQFEVFSERDG
jgi:hypothetical protein